MDRRAFLGCAAGGGLVQLAPAGVALAQGVATPERPMVLMSLIGDALTTVYERPAIGSNFNQNTRSSIALPPGALDTSVVKLMQIAVQRQWPQARLSLVAPTEATLFKGHDLWFGGAKASLPEDVVADLRATGARQLLLLSKHRADASLPMENGRAGTGQLEGLGYYVNTFSEIKNVDTKLIRTGYLAPYAYMRLALVDLETAQVLGQERLQAARVVIDERPDGDTNPWNAVPSNDKLRVLLDMVHAEIDKAVPLLLSKDKR